MKTTINVPTTAPSAVPRPPITIMASDKRMVSKENRLGETPLKWAV